MQERQSFKRKNVLHPKTSEIIWKFIEENVENCKPLRDYFQKQKFIFQYVYSKVYPVICSFTENRGITMKSEFQIKFKQSKDKKQREQVSKLEQKPIEIDIFDCENDEIEKENNELKEAKIFEKN